MVQMQGLHWTGRVKRRFRPGLLRRVRGSGLRGQFRMSKRGRVWKSGMDRKFDLLIRSKRKTFGVVNNEDFTWMWVWSQVRPRFLAKSPFLWNSAIPSDKGSSSWRIRTPKLSLWLDKGYPTFWRLPTSGHPVTYLFTFPSKLSSKHFVMACAESENDFAFLRVNCEVYCVDGTEVHLDELVKTAQECGGKLKSIL